jgi:hypothetical protein
MRWQQACWVVWVGGTALIVLSWFGGVPPQVGWLGFAAALVAVLLGFAAALVGTASAATCRPLSSIASQIGGSTGMGRSIGGNAL